MGSGARVGLHFDRALASDFERKHVKNEVRSGSRSEVSDKVKLLVVEPPEFVLMHGHRVISSCEQRAGFRTNHQW